VFVRAQDTIRNVLAPTPTVLKFLVVGLLVRLLLAPWTSFPYDTYPFYGAVVGSLAGTGPYGNVLFTYPPLFAVLITPLFMALSYFMDPSAFGTFVPSMIEVSRATGMLVPFVTSPMFNLVLKSPLILGDLLVGLTLFRTVDRWKGRAAGEKAFLIWFLNPLVIFISSVHGQFDVLAAYCTLLGALFFFDRRYILSGTLLGLGVLLKIYPVYIILVLLVALLIPLFRELREGRALRSLRPTMSFMFGGMVSLVAIIPFLLDSSSFLEYVFRRGTYSSVGGMNIWFISPLLSEFSGGEGGSEGGIPFGTILLITGFVLTLLISYFMLRKGADRKSLLLCCTMVLTVILLTQAVTNPQYLIWLFPFIVLMIEDHPRMLKKVYALSVLGLLYLFCLQSGFVFMYPMAQYIGWPSVTMLSQGIEAYFIGTSIARNIVLCSLGGAGFLVLLTVILPSHMDYLERAINGLKNWRGTDAK